MLFGLYNVSGWCVVCCGFVESWIFFGLVIGFLFCLGVCWMSLMEWLLLFVMIVEIYMVKLNIVCVCVDFVGWNWMFVCGSMGDRENE